MRGMPEIDFAIVCMNVPFTMSVVDAATAAPAFRPRVVDPVITAILEAPLLCGS